MWWCFIILDTCDSRMCLSCALIRYLAASAALTVCGQTLSLFFQRWFGRPVCVCVCLCGLCLERERERGRRSLLPFQSGCAISPVVAAITTPPQPHHDDIFYIAASELGAPFLNDNELQDISIRRCSQRSGVRRLLTGGSLQ